MEPVPPDKPEKPTPDDTGQVDSDEEDDYKEEKKLWAKEKREYLSSMKTAQLS